MKRLLGFWETTCHFAHELLYGTGNVVACAEILGEIDENNFYQAIKLLFQRHPLLRATIYPGKEGFLFELSALFNDIPISCCFYEDAIQQQKIVEAEMAELFINRKNLWRVKLLKKKDNSKQNYLLITAHHSIADAISLINFINEWLNCYTQLIINSHYQLPVLPINNNIEKLLEKTNSWDNYLKFQQQSETIHFEPMPFQEFAKLGQRHSRNIYLQFNPEHLLTLANVCRKRQVTINSLLNGIMLLTAAKMHNHTISTTLKTPVNLRRYCQPALTSEHFGCNISMVRTIHENIAPDDNIWNLATTFQQQLSTRIPELGLLPQSFDYREFELAELLVLFSMQNAKKRKHFIDGYGISNIGKIPLQRNYGDLELRSFNFSTNRHAGDFALFANVVTFRDHLNIVFTYTTPLLATTWAQQFVACFQQLLIHCLTAEKVT